MCFCFVVVPAAGFPVLASLACFVPMLRSRDCFRRTFALLVGRPADWEFIVVTFCNRFRNINIYIYIYILLFFDSRMVLSCSRGVIPTTRTNPSTPSEALRLCQSSKLQTLSTTAATSFFHPELSSIESNHIYHCTHANQSNRCYISCSGRCCCWRCCHCCGCLPLSALLHVCGCRRRRRHWLCFGWCY